MTTTAASWFYTAPENRPYLLAERLRTSYWDQRCGALWLDTVQAQGPITLAGQMDDTAVRLEWEPARWLRLATQPEATLLANATANLLRRPPTLRFTDPAGHTVWEWWVDPAAAETRWQAMQGQPAFGQPVRLTR